MPQDPRAGQPRLDRAARSRIGLGDVPGPACGSTPPRSPCRRARCRGCAGRRRSAAPTSIHQRSIPTCSTRTTWPRTGATVASPPSRRAPMPLALTTSASPVGSAERFIRVIDPPSASTRADEPAEVDRHLDDGRAHRQPGGVAGRQAGLPVGSGTRAAGRRATTGRRPRRGRARCRCASRTPARLVLGTAPRRRRTPSGPSARRAPGAGRRATRRPPRPTTSSPAAGRGRPRRPGGRPRAAALRRTGPRRPPRPRSRVA